MAYVDQNLISGENVQYRTGLHWVVLIVPVVMGFFLGLPSLIAVFNGAFGTGLALLSWRASLSQADFCVARQQSSQ